MTSDQRAAWLADARAILDAVEAHPELPVPFTGQSRAVFSLDVYGDAAPPAFAKAEQALTAALDLTLTYAPDETGPWYTLQAVMPGGLPVRLQAIAEAVADKQVTGTRVVEDSEWVRKPVPPEPGEDPETSTT